MTITADENNNSINSVLYMAIELSLNTWMLGFSDGRTNPRVVQIPSGDIDALLVEIKKAKSKFNLPETSGVKSCYEAGREGFWVYRCLMQHGIETVVLDSSSIEVPRKYRRKKTDKIDAKQLLKLLIEQHRYGIKLSICRVPSEEDEDRRRLNRERKRLQKEIISHTNRIKGLLHSHGIKYTQVKNWSKYIEHLRDWNGKPLKSYIASELEREAQRITLAQEQLEEVNGQMKELVTTSDEPVYEKVRQLKTLKGIGDVCSWYLVIEWFGWRKFNNRREVGAAAGLVGTPYDSGGSQKELGISKSGSSGIRALMIELSWLWIRYQPESQLTKWFKERFDHSKRLRKVGIVAVARKLLIALWRYVESGALPEGAILKAL